MSVNISNYLRYVTKMKFSKVDQILRLAKQTLDGYELWSGQQEIFSRKVPLESETYHLVVFKNDADYVALIDNFRAKKLMPAPTGNEDLAKKLSGLGAGIDDGFEPRFDQRILNVLFRKRGPGQARPRRSRRGRLLSRRCQLRGPARNPAAPGMARLPLTSTPSMSMIEAFGIISL